MHIINYNGGEQLPNDDRSPYRFTVTPVSQGSEGQWTVSISCGPMTISAMIRTNLEGIPVVQFPSGNLMGGFYDITERHSDKRPMVKIDPQSVPDLMRAVTMWWYDNESQEFTRDAQRLAERRRAALAKYAPDQVGAQP
ncbi:MAG: hypothetical protein FGM22_10310 [Burkholderiaceae bacterium]|nr:hypothetical protein [Burkholderiaceae bacterium]